MAIQEHLDRITKARQTATYVNVPTSYLRAITASDLPASAIRVLLCVYSACNTGQNCVTRQLTVRYVQAATGLSKPSIQRAFQQLIETQWLYRGDQSNGGTVTTAPMVPDHIAKEMDAERPRKHRPTPKTRSVQPTSSGVSTDNQPAVKSPHPAAYAPPDRSQSNDKAAERLTALRAELQLMTKDTNPDPKRWIQISSTIATLEASVANREKPTTPRPKQHFEIKATAAWARAPRSPVTPHHEWAANRVIDELYNHPTPPSMPQARLKAEILYGITVGVQRHLPPHRAAGAIRALIRSGRYRTPFGFSDAYCTASKEGEHSG